MTDNDMKWIISRWQYAVEFDSYDQWRTVRDMLHGAWMGAYPYSKEDAEVFDLLGLIAQERIDEMLECERKAA